LCGVLRPTSHRLIISRIAKKGTGNRGRLREPKRPGCVAGKRLPDNHGRKRPSARDRGGPFRRETTPPQSGERCVTNRSHPPDKAGYAAVFGHRTTVQSRWSYAAPAASMALLGLFVTVQPTGSGIRENSEMFQFHAKTAEFLQIQLRSTSRRQTAEVLRPFFFWSSRFSWRRMPPMPASANGSTTGIAIAPAKCRNSSVQKQLSAETAQPTGHPGQQTNRRAGESRSRGGRTAGRSRRPQAPTRPAEDCNRLGARLEPGDGRFRLWGF